MDASVAIKWLVAEAGSVDAGALLTRYDLLAPDLLFAECANILWKKVRRSEISADQAVDAARDLLALPLQVFESATLMSDAVKMACALDHPAYDCVYLALAARAGAPIVTADLRLLNRMMSAGLELQVVALADAQAAL